MFFGTYAAQYNNRSMFMVFFSAAADRARGLVGQKFSYLLRGNAIIAKNLRTLETSKPTQTTNKTQNKQKHPQKGTQGTRWKGETDAPENLCPQPFSTKKKWFPLIPLPFHTPQGQAQNQSEDRSEAATVLCPQRTQVESAFSPSSNLSYLSFFHVCPQSQWCHKHDILLLGMHGEISYVCPHFAPVYPLLCVSYLCNIMLLLLDPFPRVCIRIVIVINKVTMSTVRENEPWQTTETTAAFSSIGLSPHESHIPYVRSVAILVQK